MAEGCQGGEEEPADDIRVVPQENAGGEMTFEHRLKSYTRRYRYTGYHVVISFVAGFMSALMLCDILF